MFSTLLGPLPPDPDRPSPTDDAVAAAHLRDDVSAIAATGLELIADGLPAATPRDAVEAVVARWHGAATESAVAVKAVILGPSAHARATDTDPRAAADAIRERVLAVAAAGCPLVEIDEPDAPWIAADPSRWQPFAEAHRRILDGTDGIHMSLALTGGNVDALGSGILFDLPYSSYAFDLIDGPDNWRLIAQAPSDRGIVCGALGMSRGADRTRELLVWAAHYAASTNGRGLERVGLANAPARPETTRADALARLAIVAEASRIAAVESAEELASMLDPRAIDARSAAFGRFAPGRRRRP